MFYEKHPYQEIITLVSSVLGPFCQGFEGAFVYDKGVVTKKAELKKNIVAFTKRLETYSSGYFDSCEKMVKGLVRTLHGPSIEAHDRIKESKKKITDEEVTAKEIVAGMDAFVECAYSFLAVLNYINQYVLSGKALKMSTPVGMQLYFNITEKANFLSVHCGEESMMVSFNVSEKGKLRDIKFHASKENLEDFIPYDSLQEAIDDHQKYELLCQIEQCQESAEDEDNAMSKIL